VEIIPRSNKNGPRVMSKFMMIWKIEASLVFCVNPFKIIVIISKILTIIREKPEIDAFRVVFPVVFKAIINRIALT
jgi:hypothetical protein